MACKQASNFGIVPPAADYLTRPVANDNWPPSPAREWISNFFSISACCAAQFFWSVFLMAQLNN